MTLEELLSSPLPTPSELESLCLAMPTAVAQRMVNLYAWHGDPRCTMFPGLASDGRWIIPAEILRDCVTPGGTYFLGFRFVDDDMLSQVDVLPVSSVTLAAEQAVLTPEPKP